MQVSPESPSKRSRAKAKAKDAAATAPRKGRKPKAEPVAAVQLAAADLNSTIAIIAYYLAAERNFAPGYELDDWLEAERRVRSKML